MTGVMMSEMCSVRGAGDGSRGDGKRRRLVQSGVDRNCGR